MTLRLKKEGAVAHLLIDRAEKRNAFDQMMWERLPALVAEAEGDVAKARTLMRDAASLSRRDSWAQTWLLSDYAKQGDLTNSLAAFDRTLRTSSSGQSRMLPAMFNMLARPDLVEPLTMLLLKRPPWADAFWREAPKHPAGLANAAAIRAELARQGIPGDENQNRALMSALAAAEENAIDSGDATNRSRAASRADETSPTTRRDTRS